MTVFEYELNDSNKVYTIEADFYAVEKETTKNLRGEESDVVEYVFYKNEEAFWRIPLRFMGKIRELE